MSTDGNVSPEEFAKLQAMADQALKTAEEAKTAAEARSEVRASVKEEAEAQGIQMDEQTATMIANATVAQLEARGAFGAPPEEAQPEVPFGGGTPPQVSTTPPTSSAVASEPPATGGSGTLPEEEAFEAPRKKSLAERFQGK